MTPPAVRLELAPLQSPLDLPIATGTESLRSALPSLKVLSLQTVQILISLQNIAFHLDMYSKICVKRPLKNRQNKDDKW